MSTEQGTDWEVCPEQAAQPEAEHYDYRVDMAHVPAVEQGDIAIEKPNDVDPTVVRTLGQMRALIMDFPSSLLAASFFKAFSDGTRLRLLQALSIREMCVSDLCALLELNQPAVSNHLRILSNQKIVKSRRSGKNIFYSLDDWHINAIIGMAMEHLSFACPD